MAHRSIKRIQKDIKLYHTSDINTHGIYVNFNENDIYNAKALIIGPKESPYQNGYYFFDIIYPQNYPQTSPKVTLYTLNKYVRFNPNLYTNGKVCLSILGTWSGPGWTPCLSTNEVLLSIQSLLNNNPIQNEPGYELLTLENSSRARSYVDIIDYHNHQVAILQVLTSIPSGFDGFRDIIEKHFLDVFQENINHVIKRKVKLDKSQLQLRMYNLNLIADYSHIEMTYNKLHKILSEKYAKIIPAISKEEQTKHTEQTPIQNEKDNSNDNTNKHKKRVPSLPAADFDIDYIIKSDNDGRQYKVTLVKGRNNTSHKRWILIK